MQLYIYIALHYIYLFTQLFSAGNDYVFNDYQLPQTWLRNQVLVTMSSEQNATFLMKPFNVFEDNSLMIPSLSFSWKANAEAISIPDSISSPPLEQKIPVDPIYLYYNSWNSWCTQWKKFSKLSTLVKCIACKEFTHTKMLVFYFKPDEKNYFLSIFLLDHINYLGYPELLRNKLPWVPKFCT